MSLTQHAAAHRGGAGLAPENTLAAFQMSHALGIRLMETDVRVTRDGVALAFHDATLKRITGIKGRVKDYTFDEIRSVRIDGEPILRLDDLLAAFPDSSFLVDVKEARSVAPTVAAIRSTSTAEQVCVAGGWDDWLRAVTDATGCQRALGWKALTSLMCGARSGTRLHKDASAGAIGAHVPQDLVGLGWMANHKVGARLVDMAHDAGLRLLAWTVNDPQAMKNYLELGADAVITDRPDLLREVLIERGQWKATAAAELATNVTAWPGSAASQADDNGATAGSRRLAPAS